jgi:hypothetical protein
VLVGNDEQVPGRDGSDVEEGTHEFVAVDEAGRCLTSDNAAEDAVGPRCRHVVRTITRWEVLPQMARYAGERAARGIRGWRRAARVERRACQAKGGDRQARAGVTWDELDSGPSARWDTNRPKRWSRSLAGSA